MKHWNGIIRSSFFPYQLTDIAFITDIDFICSVQCVKTILINQSNYSQIIDNSARFNQIKFIFMLSVYLSFRVVLCFCKSWQPFWQVNAQGSFIYINNLVGDFDAQYIPSFSLKVHELNHGFEMKDSVKCFVLSFVKRFHFYFDVTTSRTTPWLDWLVKTEKCIKSTATNI